MLTLFFLQSSRAIRPAWLLEELNVSYDLKFANRQSDGTVPDALGVPTAVGKSPAIQDGDFILGESGAINRVRNRRYSNCCHRYEEANVLQHRYICEKYDTKHRLLPSDLSSAPKSAN
jgi:glutathione S-transferase